MVLYYLISTIITFVMLAFWVLMILDCVKRNDFFWLWIVIIFFPLGALIYYMIHRPAIIIPRLDVGLSASAPFQPERIKELKAKINRSPDAHLYLQLGRLYLDGGKPQEAVPALQEALRMDPQDLTTVHFYLGKALMAVDKPDEAVSALVAAMASKDRGQVSEACRILAEYYAASGKDDKALEYYEKLIGIYPFSEARYAYGELLEKHNRLDEAKAQMKALVSESGDLPSFSLKKEKEWIRKAEAFLRNHGEG
jgi:hypothetical protein